jgi:hypothetical protein
MLISPLHAAAPEWSDPSERLALVLRLLARVARGLADEDRTVWAQADVARWHVVKNRLVAESGVEEALVALAMLLIFVPHVEEMPCCGSPCLLAEAQRDAEGQGEGTPGLSVQKNYARVDVGARRRTRRRRRGARWSDYPLRMQAHRFVLWAVWGLPDDPVTAAAAAAHDASAVRAACACHHAMHLCGNGTCVNWRHLRWGTPKDNKRALECQNVVFGPKTARPRADIHLS